jgi:hypothetical protein
LQDKLYSWTIEQIDRHRSSAEDYTNMSYYNLCGIGSQQNNISKGKGKKKENVKSCLN